jgi:hypothetical protein
MSDSVPRFSLNEIEALLQRSQNAQNFLRKELVASYDEFVEVLYDELDLIISTLEANPQFYYSDDEDKITHTIVTALQMRNYAATQGTTTGGNVDITVPGPNSAWTWIGEAKIFTSLNSLSEGFLQLTTRYRNASPVFACRGLLAYTKRHDVSEHLKMWDEEVQKLGLEEFVRTDCNRRGKLAFYTSHKDKSSGLPVKIRHNAICLYHLPEDKSGRTAKKYQERRQTEAVAARPTKAKPQVKTSKTNG